MLPCEGQVVSVCLHIGFEGWVVSRAGFMGGHSLEMSSSGTIEKQVVSFHSLYSLIHDYKKLS